MLHRKLVCSGTVQEAACCCEQGGAYGGRQLPAQLCCSLYHWVTHTGLQKRWGTVVRWEPATGNAQPPPCAHMAGTNPPPTPGSAHSGGSSSPPPPKSTAGRHQGGSWALFHCSSLCLLQWHAFQQGGDAVGERAEQATDEFSTGGRVLCKE